MFWALVAIFVVAMFVAFLGATRLTTPDRLIWFFLAGWMGSFLAVVPLISPNVRKIWLGVILVYSGVVIVLTPFLLPPSLLAAKGEPVTATIVDARHIQDEDDLMYSLQDPAGLPLGGVLKADDTHSIGEKVDVVVDRGGLLHPMLAKDLEGDNGWAGPIGLLPFFALLVLFCWFAVRPRGCPTHPTRSSAFHRVPVWKSARSFSCSSAHF
jgi:hypothetical protein